MDSAFYKSLKTPALRKSYERLRDALVKQSPDERSAEDLERLVAMRNELDRRTGIPIRDIDFEKYITD